MFCRAAVNILWKSNLIRSCERWFLLLFQVPLCTKRAELSAVSSNAYGLFPNISSLFDTVRKPTRRTLHVYRQCNQTPTNFPTSICKTKKSIAKSPLMQCVCLHQRGFSYEQINYKANALGSSNANFRCVQRCGALRSYTQLCRRFPQWAQS